MGDRRRDDDEEETKQREDLQVSWELMDEAVAVDIEAFACVVAVVMLPMGVLLRLDGKVDLTSPSSRGI